MSRVHTQGLTRLTDSKPLSEAAQRLRAAVSDLFPYAVAVRLSRAEGRWACSDLTAPGGAAYELIPFGGAAGELSGVTPKAANALLLKMAVLAGYIEGEHKAPGSTNLKFGKNAYGAWLELGPSLVAKSAELATEAAAAA